MANNTQKSPDAKVFGSVAKKAKTAPKAAKKTGSSGRKKTGRRETRSEDPRGIFAPQAYQRALAL